MGLAAILFASQVKQGGMLDPQKIIGQLTSGSKPGGQQQQQQGYGAQGQHGGGYGVAGAGAGAGAAAGYYSGGQQQQYSSASQQQQSYGASQQGYAPQQQQQQQQHGYPQASYGATSPPPAYGGGYPQQQGMPSPGGAFPQPSHSPSSFPQPSHSPSFPTPQHNQYSSSGSQSFPQPSHSGYQPQYHNSAPPQPNYSSSSGYDQRGLGTVAGAAAIGGAAYYAYNKHQGSKLPFGGSHTGMGSAASDPAYLTKLLQDAVLDQNIQAFYPPGSLEPLAQHLARSNAIPAVAQLLGLHVEVALDLARLALFDVVLFLDDSGSMKFEEGGTRIDDLRLVVSRAAAAAGLFDSDGLSILTMNGQQKWDGVNSEQGAARIVDQIQYSGMTPLGSMFQRKAVEPLLLGPARQGTLRKPLLFIVVTDGEPTSESRSKLAEVIQSAKDELSRTRYGADAFSLELACVGNDQGARRFLEEIDGHPQIGRYVDVTSNYENESDNMLKANPPIQLTPDLYILKLLLGGIDSSYDRKDER